MPHSIRRLTEAEFPERLLEIPQPPKQLFLQGTLPPIGNKLLCVVGARKYTPYGKEICEMLISGLRGLPVTIVSGLALGIDGIAHRSALSAGLHTLAVPGSGIDRKVLYPASHRNLAEEILNKGGGLLSEFDLDFHATQYSFPQRNRIMAGLSHAVLIIEAEKKSGTLITARLATDYNRDVLTIPGSIFSPTSTGPHLLLRIGATPITSVDELKEALGFEIKESPEQKQIKFENCTLEEKEILTIIQNGMARDEIISSIKKPIQEINALLSLMEIKELTIEREGLLYPL
ncbi:MAG: DNA-processing protein DprA [Candidatus Paceibacterota bacterium]|jgi:DNA processing protein